MYVAVPSPPVVLINRSEILLAEADTLAIPPEKDGSTGSRTGADQVKRT